MEGNRQLEDTDFYKKLNLDPMAKHLELVVNNAIDSPSYAIDDFISC